MMPEWVEPIARYMLEEGLRDARIAAFALVGSTIIGVTLGTLLTIRLPADAVADPSVHRGLAGAPILITIFIIFFALPAARASRTLAFDAVRGGARSA